MQQARPPDEVITRYRMMTGIRDTSCMTLYREVSIRQATAWFLMQCIRESFIEDLHLPFPGPVEVNAAAVGDRHREMSKARRDELREVRGGRGSVSTAIVAGVKDRVSKQIRIAFVKRFDTKTLQGMVLGGIEGTAMVYADESQSFTGLPRTQKEVGHLMGEYVRGIRR